MMIRISATLLCHISSNLAVPDEKEVEDLKTRILPVKPHVDAAGLR
jgi:hypothetical protein